MTLLDTPMTLYNRLWGLFLSCCHCTTSATVLDATRGSTSVTDITSVTGITSDTATRGDWYRLLGGSGRTPGSRCWVRSAWALYGPSSTSSSHCAQHNPTHCAHHADPPLLLPHSLHLPSCIIRAFHLLIILPFLTRQLKLFRQLQDIN